MSSKAWAALAAFAIAVVVASASLVLYLKYEIWWMEHVFAYSAFAATMLMAVPVAVCVERLSEAVGDYIG